jgi:MOSC domain-containing protein YiiM
MPLIVVGRVQKLFISQSNSHDRHSLQTMQLDCHGIIGDKYYQKSSERSILITSLDSYRLAHEHGIAMEHASLGENLLIDYNPYELQQGDRLHIGSAILAITQHCTLCEHLASIDARVPKLLKDDRGIFAKVIQAGKITVNDEIYLDK